MLNENLQPCAYLLYWELCDFYQQANFLHLSSWQNLPQLKTKCDCTRICMLKWDSASFRSWWTVREIPRSRYSHATTLQHLRARKLVRRTRSVHSRTRAPAKLVSTTMDFRAFVAKAPHLTIPRQRTPVYEGKLLFSNATAKIPKAISQKRHDGFSFSNDGNLDKCLSKKKSRLATPALWLSSLHWAKCMTNSYPLRSPSK